MNNRKPTIIIAEAGVNHNGSLEIAKRLVDVAAEAGVDYVKFQTFQAAKLAAPSAKTADYQKANTGLQNESQFAMLKKLELSHEAHRELVKYCELKNVRFFSTGFDLDSLEFLAQLGLKLFKVPSGEITNWPYLRKIASLAEEVILSTGMSTLGDIEAALETLMAFGTPRNRITVLHCNTEYPTPMQDVNLLAMKSIGEALKVDFGYSDHTLGITVPTAAVALGATVIEKHFTLSREMDGPDHRASLEPSELIAMVQAIRNVELALGDGIKRPSASERKNLAVARKSIVASRPIRKGERFTEENLTTKRPGSGTSPMRWPEILGTSAPQDYSPDELI